MGSNVRIHSLSVFWKDGIPDKTDLCCWWCTEGFDNKPWGCPVKCKTVKGAVTKFEVTGCFCSASCAKAFALKELPRNQQWRCCEWISLISLKTNKTARVTSAPGRYTLKKFGGPYTIQKFREKAVMGWRCNLQMHSFSHIYMHVNEESTNAQARCFHADPLGNNADGESTEVQQPPNKHKENLVPSRALKRTKPLPTSTLSNLMGVRIKPHGTSK